MLRTAYCSNVHAGPTLATTKENLLRYSVAVKQKVSPNQNMGVGLWLSNVSAKELLASQSERAAFSDLLKEEGLETFTFNGFPFGDFHQPVVKHAVYLPTWFEAERLHYTKDLFQLLHQFAPEGEASISTLPIAWGNPAPSGELLSVAAQQLRDLASYLARLESETGRLMYLCIEPEPGCYMQYTQDIVRFYESFLLDAKQDDEIRRHIRVCHDVCHAVVMAEKQSESLAAYQAAGIGVGKVQISSAVEVDFDAITPDDRRHAFAEMSAFAEDRYLHQTTIQQPGEEAVFYEDLPLALASVSEPSAATGTWRIHFHIPVYLNKFGHLTASQQSIIDCLSECRRYSDVQHFEVETYAWNVLPDDLQQEDLADGIAEELRWFQSAADKYLQ